MQYEGQCLYGRVILKTEQTCYEITACHCLMYQKWNGYLLMRFIIERDLSIEDKTNVSYCHFFAWLVQKFCNKCSHFFSKMFNPESHYISVTLFEQSQIAFLVTQFYIGCNPLYYKLIEEKALFTQQHILNT
ncbi:hypothetical protein [Arsenophonus nasoniae]|uniref:Glutathione-dependent formaldehyde-activating enzyme n=1 Tax=Arsenophonus nasoniae TaxID=638 RepID=A0AA95GD95_9GAMM|nr:hypothetical protein [Arsenophonus nasoniae]WGL96642.1 hypothetical protein QE207_08960 [Arsenophonus nasoniae]